ncbi:MAG TPA: signal peptidase II [Puia sp.]|nr:signal peptidase II [Puia sp.]
MKTKYKILIFCFSCFAFIGCDRVTKDFAKLHLKDSEPLSWFHNTIRLEYVENTGAFLSFGADWPQKISFWALTFLPLLFLSGLFVYTLKKSKEMNFSQMLPFALIFSGGIGNIIDRAVFDRHVIDFMNLGINDFRTGIFNLADVYVTTGVLLFIVAILRKKSESMNGAE